MLLVQTTRLSQPGKLSSPINVTHGLNRGFEIGLDVKDVDAGCNPEWATKETPDISMEYWQVAITASSTFNDRQHRRILGAHG